MKQAIEVLEKLEQNSSRNIKEDILIKEESEELKFAFSTALNPFYNYNCSDFDDHQDHRSDIPTYKEVLSLRDNLLDKTYVGNSARGILKKTLLTSDPIARKWLVKMFKKDMNCGAAITTINKIYKGLIPVFEIGLCQKYDGGMLPGDWIAEPKYDGNRAIAFVDHHYNVNIVSRNNKPVYNTELIKEQLADVCKMNDFNNVMFDGEMYATDWNDSISILHTQTKVNSTKMCYYIFDMISMEEWATQVTKKLDERKKALKRFFDVKELLGGHNLDNIKLTPGYEFKTIEEAKEIYKRLLTEGYEGVVLKHVGSMYPFGRNGAWLKWKPVETYEVKIVDFEIGDGKFSGILGAFICNFNGKKVKVGGGFKDKQRKAFWENREAMKGKIIEVECQQVTKDGSLRFPVFKRIREDKDAEDVLSMKDKILKANKKGVKNE